MKDLAVVDVETGEYLPAGHLTLDELARELRELLAREVADNWDKGRILAMARALADDRERCAAAGLRGPNGDARFGRWVSANFAETPIRTLHDCRRLFEVFGHRRGEVEHIPQSGLYKLAQLESAELDGALTELKRLDRPKISDVDAAIRAAKGARPSVLASSFVDGCSVDDLSTLTTKFGCIYADPPWQYGNQATRAATGNHYSGMSIDEICALPIESLAADVSHLHLWTTNGFLEDAFRVMRAWGFTYKSCFVWVKPQMGIGNYWRVSHEFMLLGVRGSCPFADKSLMSWAAIDRTRHSAKPDEIRRMIERASPGPRLELFARRLSPGWVSWGNEIERTMFEKVAANG